jgi:hypothetical protein
VSPARIGLRAVASFDRLVELAVFDLDFPSRLHLRVNQDDAFRDFDADCDGWRPTTAVWDGERSLEKAAGGRLVGCSGHVGGCRSEDIGKREGGQSNGEFGKAVTHHSAP